jgi:urease beta subunit
MKANDNNVAVASSDTVPANKVGILRFDEKPATGDSLKIVDEESIRFDPYDTASLYVQKTADQS